MMSRHKPLRLAALATVSSLTLLATNAGASGQQADAYDAAKDPWFEGGQAALAERLALQPNTNRAKNVIIFIADGFGITAATVTRIYDGQLKGGEGEENFLNHERFPYNALIKTYSADGQISDSAATASAIMTGVKANSGMVSAPSAVGRSDCATLALGAPESLAELADRAGMATGVITTTVITDATPASTYAHSPNRSWMVPSAIPEEGREQGCQAISDQLMGFNFDVAMGGGRVLFTPEEEADVEETEKGGARKDGRNLVSEWQESNPSGEFVYSRKQLLDLDLDETDRLFGLFARGSMVYEFEDGSDGIANPSLAEMTGAALDVLAKDEDGFFLLVEHEGTDDLQHGGYARQMADAAREIEAAVEVALSKVDLSETLVIFTSDHSQAISFSGYIVKGNPIFGLARTINQRTGEEQLARAKDGKPYTSVGFYAGPGAFEGERPDLSEVETAAADFKAQALLGSGGVPHSGEDVVAYANGPWAHLFGGLIEQNVIFHIINHAAGLTERADSR